MNSKHILSYMLRTSGRRKADVSRDIGKNSHYLAAQTRNDSTPRMRLVIDVAKACGYEVVLKGHDEEIVLE